MMKKTLKYFTLFIIFGAIYITIEIIYRGHSHWTMFILGGICSVCIGLLNEVFPWDMPIWVQTSIGAVIITALEFVCGVVVNIWLQWNVWDYSNVPLNFLGQICLPFVLIWLIASCAAIVLDDYLRYWIFNEEKPHYTFWSSKPKE